MQIESQIIVNIIFIFLITEIRNVSTDEEASGAVYLWKPDEYPSLTVNAKYCTGNLRNPPTSVCDPDGIINPSQAQQLDQLIDTEQNRTTCFCNPCSGSNPKGLLIKIALVRSINIFTNYSIDKSLEHFAELTRLKWNLAKKCHHDVLIFVATTYNKVVISMGSKAERVIGYKKAQEIIEDTRKHFNNNYVFEGLETIVTSLQHEALNFNPLMDKLGFRQGHLIWIILGLVLLTIIIICFARYCLFRKWNNLKTDPKEYKTVEQNEIQNEVY